MIIMVLLAATAGIYLALNSKPKPQACTLEAKICPDGTSVGRTGPNCEFSPCPTKPTPTDETVNWKTYNGNLIKVRFKYPPDWGITETKGYESGGIIFNTEISIKNPNNRGISLVVNPGEGFAGLRLVREKEIVIDGISLKKRYFAESTDEKSLPVVFMINSKDPKRIFTVIGDLDANGPKNDQTFDQILSTFRFLDLSPTPTCRPRPACLDATPRCLISETSDMCPKAVVCTQDAKLCPDGKTYVSRQRPNCEFALCP